MADRIFECEVPMPPRELSPNARVHWTVRRAVAQTYRLAVKCAVLQTYDYGSWPRFRQARCELVFCRPNARRIDNDNLLAGFKAGFDQLVAMGVIPDDNADHLAAITVSRRVERGCQPRVLVRFTEVVMEE